MIGFIRKELPFLIAAVAIIAYSTYFSLFTILRSEKLYAHYFDLGIMHQTTYNTYMSLKKGDMSRFLELTNAHDGAGQIKRMAIHNDIFLALLAPFYFIHDGPETLLVIQALIVSFGAIFIYLITEHVFAKIKYYDWLALAFSLAYLLYTPMQKATAFDFHAVTLSPTFLLGMYHFYLIKQYRWSFVFAILAILTKEQVGLVTGFFALYILLQHVPKRIKTTIPHFWNLLKKKNSEIIFAFILGTLSLCWVVLSMTVIIPMFRGSEHFGSEYYSYLGENPLAVFPVIFRYETFHYLFLLLSPLGLLSLLSPLNLLIALPEFGVVLLSGNGNMRNIYFHYAAVITAFVFISSIYGARRLIRTHVKKYSMFALIALIMASSLWSSYTISAMPWAKNFDRYPWTAKPAQMDDMQFWKAFLKDENIKVSTTGRLAPHFTSRRYFYDFSWKYVYADYVLIDAHEAMNGYLKEKSIPAYNAILTDWKYIKIYDNDGLKVYKRLIL